MIYSKRALHFCVISTVVGLVFVILSQMPRSKSNGIDSFTSFLITLQYVAILLAFVTTMLALKEKPKSKIQRLAQWLNIIYFFTLVGYLLLSYLFMD